MDPIGLCFAESLRGTSFQKGRLPALKRKVQYRFPTPFKWKEYQLDPLGAPFAASLQGIKVKTTQFYPERHLQQTLEKTGISNSKKRIFRMKLILKQRENIEHRRSRN